jgi:SAM-dependent methyltransferase
MHRLDIRSVLSTAPVYRGFRRIIAGPRRDALVIERLAVRSGHRLLDIGCGTGDLLDLLPEDVGYVGVDASPDYIAAARARHGARGTFHVFQLGQGAALELGRFDRVLADGVIHHLDAATAEALFTLARDVLEPDGRLVTIDPCFVDGQGWLVSGLLRADRGEYVRTAPAYQALARMCFTDVRSEARRDLMRLPYCHLLMECRNPAPPTARPAATR